jgi:transposase
LKGNIFSEKRLGKRKMRRELGKLTLPRFGRVSKTEIYSLKISKGLPMAKVLKVYTREFKEQAVCLAQTSGKPITHVAREPGISDSSIHQWRTELAEHGPEAFPKSRAPNAVGRREPSAQM